MIVQDLLWYYRPHNQLRLTVSLSDIISYWRLFLELITGFCEAGWSMARGVYFAKILPITAQMCVFVLSVCHKIQTWGWISFMFFNLISWCCYYNLFRHVSVKTFIFGKQWLAIRNYLTRLYCLHSLHCLMISQSHSDITALISRIMYL